MINLLRNKKEKKLETNWNKFQKNNTKNEL